MYDFQRHKPRTDGQSHILYAFI